MHKHTSTDTHTQSQLCQSSECSLCFLCATITSCWSVIGQNGNTALSIARRLGYISVVDTLRPLTDENLTTMVRQFSFHIRSRCLIHLQQSLNKFQSCDYFGYFETGRILEPQKYCVRNKEISMIMFEMFSNINITYNKINIIKVEIQNN